MAMGSNSQVSRTNEHIAIISLLFLSVFPVLFSARALDDNALTSWIWVFHDSRALTVYLFLVAVLPVAFLIARSPFQVKRKKLIIFLISFSTAIPLWSSPETIMDASRYFTQAKHLELYGPGFFFTEWGKEIDAWTDMPAVPFLYGLIFRFAGEERLYIQIFTSFLFSLTVLLTYLTGKELFDENTSVLGAMFLLGMPYLLTQVPLMLVDIPVMFFLLLSIYTFLLALKQGGLMAGIISPVVITITVFSKYSTWPMLSVLGCIFVTCRMFPKITEAWAGEYEGGGGRHFRTDMELRRLFLRGGSVALTSAVLIGLFFFMKSDVVLDQLSLLISYQKPGLDRWTESFISTFFFQIHPFVTAAAIFSIYLAVRNRDPKMIIICWLLIIVFLFRIRRIRYIIMVFPMFSLMAAYGLKNMKDIRVKTFLVSAVVMSSIVIAYAGYLPFLKSMSAANLKEAGKYIDSLDGDYIKVKTVVPDDLVANPSVSVPLLDLFTNKKILYEYPEKEFKIAAEEIETSSLRFTWAYRNPLYYRGKESARGLPLIIISDKNDLIQKGVMPEGYSLNRIFSLDENVFRFRTAVAVFRPYL